MALTDQERAGIHREIMRVLSEQHVEIAGLTKAELRAAINAIDAWVDANQASFNNAIPQPARGALSAKQKSWLFEFILRRRRELA